MKKDKTIKKLVHIGPIPKGKKEPDFITKDVRESIKEHVERHLIFSFLYFDRNHEAFNLGGNGVTVSWFIGLLDTLKQLCNITKEQLRTTHRERFRAHEIDFNDTEYKSFPLPPEMFEQLNESGDCWQIGISKANGRIHGFFYENIFHIIWLDRYHNLYPMKHHGGLKLHPPAMSDYDLLKAENEELKKEIRDLYELLDMKTAPDGDSSQAG